MSVDQWAFQFKLWSTIRDENICRFTSDSKERFRGNAGVVVTTYNMVAFGGKRSEESEKIIEEIRNREWGLLLMDEVFKLFYDYSLLNCNLKVNPYGNNDGAINRYMWFLHICFGRSLASLNLTANLGSQVCIIGLAQYHTGNDL